MAVISRNYRLFTALILGFIFSAAGAHCFSQDSVIAIRKQLTNSKFVDCYSYNNDLVALTRDGKILQINLSDFSIRKTLSHPEGFSTMSVDRNGMIWAADSFKTIYSYRDTGWKNEDFVFADNIWEFAFTNDNGLLLITDKGIYNSRTGMFYGLNKYRGRRFSSLTMSRYRAVSFYVDKRDDLWIYSESRVHREVHVFSTRKNRYITDAIKGIRNFWRIRSVFGNGKRIFFSEWNDYGMSAIYSYKKDTIQRLHHPEYDTMTIGPSPAEEEYISAACFDKKTNQIYYYAGNGIYKAVYNKRKNKLEKPVQITTPQFTWDGSSFSSSLFARWVKKIFILNNYIIFLNRDAGIFVFDGKEMHNLR